MSKYLISTTETYRADSEREAQELIDEAKACTDYELTKYTSQKKESKSKGEVVDEWMRVTLTKSFSDEKDPGPQTTITYEVGV